MFFFRRLRIQPKVLVDCELLSKEQLRYFSFRRIKIRIWFPSVLLFELGLTGELFDVLDVTILQNNFSILFVIFDRSKSSAIFVMWRRDSAGSF